MSHFFIPTCHCAGNISRFVLYDLSREHFIGYMLQFILQESDVIRYSKLLSIYLIQNGALRQWKLSMTSQFVPNICALLQNIKNMEPGTMRWFPLFGKPQNTSLNIFRADGVFLDKELFKKKCFHFNIFLLSAQLFFFNSLLLINPKNS